MTLAILYKLLAIFATVAVGWVAGRMRWLGQAAGGTDPARTLGNAAFYIFVPALLFRTTARLDMAHMPWLSVAAFFVPVVAMMLLVYLSQRFRPHQPPVPGAGAGVDAGVAADVVADVVTDVAAAERRAAVPSTRAIAVCFGNSVQIGIPMAAALFGEPGLGLHIALVSLHALVILSLLTALVELDLARARAAHQPGASLWRTLAQTARNTIIHPVVLPVLAGMVWHLVGLPLPGPVDETLQLLGTAVAPLCLVLIGLSLAYSSVRGAVLEAVVITLLKLLALPALVLVVAHWGFGLSGVPLEVVVMMASLPTGSNALIFAQRYRAQEAAATTAIVLSTLGFVLTAPLWLMVLMHLR